jgi:hypothetical protein
MAIAGANGVTADNDPNRAAVAPTRKSLLALSHDFCLPER